MPVSRAERRPMRLHRVPVMVGGDVSALAGCRSGGSSSARATGGPDAAAKVPTSPSRQTGPDSDAHPVGAALTQIVPLLGIHRPDTYTSVNHTVSKLVPSDQASYHSNGTDKRAATAIKKAEATLHKACPGVAS